MNLLDMFKTAPAPTAAPPAAANPVGPPTTTIPTPPGPVTQEGPGTAPNGAVPAVDPNTTPSVDNSPLAEFKGIWDNPATDPNKTPDPNAPEVFNREDVAKAVDGMSFDIPTEQLTAITAGGENAGAALSQVMAAVAKQAVTQSTLINNEVTNRAVSRALAAQEAKLPDLLRSQQNASHLRDTNALFSNPAIAPVAEAAQERLQSQFPDATPQEITQMTTSFIMEMGKAFQPAPTVDQADRGTDWNLFLPKENPNIF